MTAYGEPDGYGHYGMLDTDDDGLVICHDCGGSYRHLATHARLTHGYPTAEAYREAHGLARKTALVAPATSAKMRANWFEGESWRAPLLAEVRKPLEAGKGRNRYRVQARVARATAKPSRDLTEAEIESLGDWWDVPEWTRRCHLLLASTGLPVMAVARSLDVSHATVSTRLRRYPA